ncbi:CAP domain-containing protein [Frankia sp. Cr1]|uniref:CAP domain-containing protein n=1 Tax=Frankia sp. Cr1 TaxID=3073931 RepID=UPI002AD2F6A9|nr:CAP domain-containing protein [Frankia sp. Cr1]
MTLHGKSRFYRRGPLLIAMVATILALAPLLVLLRSTLIPSWTHAQLDPAGKPQPSISISTSPNIPTCEAGQGCARGEATTTPQPNASNVQINASNVQPTFSEAEPTATDDEARLVDLVNAERERAGCPVLQLNDRLRASARAHAADMASRVFIGQINPDHEGPDARARKNGYWGNVIEVIGAGLPTVDEVFVQWTDLQNPAARKIHTKWTDCSWVSAGIAYNPGRVKPTFREGIWVLDLGDT